MNAEQLAKWRTKIESKLTDKSLSECVRILLDEIEEINRKLENHDECLRSLFNSSHSHQDEPNY